MFVKDRDGYLTFRTTCFLIQYLRRHTPSRAPAEYVLRNLPPRGLGSIESTDQRCLRYLRLRYDDAPSLLSQPALELSREHIAIKISSGMSPRLLSFVSFSELNSLIYSFLRSEDVSRSLDKHAFVAETNGTLSGK